MMTPQTNPAESYRQFTRPQGPLVMLVDDCEIDNFVNKKMLNRYGLSDRIISYESSSHALEYLANEENEMPVYLFLDLHMPVMDGEEFLEKLKALNPALEQKCDVIILSNSLDPQIKTRMTNKKNVLAFFSKPLIKSNVDEILGKTNNLQYANAS